VKLFGRHRTEDRALTRADVPAVMMPTTIAGETVTARNALALADVWACVRCLSDAVSTLPLVVYRRTGDGRERVTDLPVAELLRTPAPGVTQPNLTGQIMAHLALWGECFIGKYWQGDRVVQLGLLAPDRVTVEVRAGEPTFTHVAPDGRQQVLTGADVVHVRGLSVDGVRGVSPVALCREALGLAGALATHASATMANGAVPRGILRVPAGAAGDDQARNLADAWGARHGGSQRAGRVAVLTGEVSFEPVSMPMADAEFVAQRKLSTVEVARIFRVPPWMVAADSGESMTYSNTESQAAAFVKFTLAPWLRVIEAALSSDPDLFPLPNTYAEFLVEGLLRADSSTRAQFYTAALNPQTGWMTRAEVRDLENLPRERQTRSDPAPPGQ
jgi:HK97 family phage portal protein